VYDLIVESQQLDRKIQQISERPNWLTDVFESRKTVDWPEILKDVGRRTPKLVRITELSGKADAGINLEGLALTHEAVHTFVEMLNGSEYVESASLNHTERDNGSEGLVRYSITCWLGAGSKSG
jgi:Tfp pilus assembly protein PilN